MLIVVGDPSVLSIDPLWRSFLNYVHINGGWRGKPISWDPSIAVDKDAYDKGIRDASFADMNKLTRRMEALTLAGIDSGDDEEGEDANVDKPWREVE